MREIKFRAWDVFNADMFPTEGNRDLSAAFFIEVNKRRTGGNNIHVMQYTGLHDKDGVEIYEGDILDLHSTVNGCNIFVVEWDNPGWTIRYGCPHMVNPRLYEYDVRSFFAPCEFSGEVDYEVIGNIHENPKLLEK